MADITVDVDWAILPATEVPGNNANRFDCWRQSDTLGPQPPTAETGPPEQGGSEVPKAGG